MSCTRFFALASCALSFFGMCFDIRPAQAVLTEFTWDGATGTQAWQDPNNWDQPDFPNDPLHVANLAVGLGGNLSVNVGTTGNDVTIAGLNIGGTSVAVVSEVSSAGALLRLQNDDGNNMPTIHTGGTSGNINLISTDLRLANSFAEVQGTVDLFIVGNLSFENSDPNAPVENVIDASLSNTSADVTTTINGNVSLVNQIGGVRGTLGLNTSDDASGLLIVNGQITDDGHDSDLFIGAARSKIPLPLNTVRLNSVNTYGVSTVLRRANLELGNDQALGTSTLKVTGSVKGPGGPLGFNLIPMWGDRTIANDVLISHWLTVKGDNSLELSGNITQTNNRGIINLLENGSTLTLSGRLDIWNDDEIGTAREFEFDGTGTTRVTGLIRDQPDDPNFVGVSDDRRIVKTGTGVLVIDVGAGDNDHTGQTTVMMGNMHYANNDSLNVGNGLIRSYGGAVGVDTGVASNATFNSKLDPSSTGGLMLPSFEAAATVDFTSTLSNASNMTLAAPETGLTFTGSIIPANSTYGLGGGTGILTLPFATLTGANNLSVRNGGTVVLLGDNTYTGTTEIRSRYTSSRQEQAEIDSSNEEDGGESVFLDRHVNTTLFINELADAGIASSLGMGADPNDADEIVIHGATLKYLGSGDSTNRLFTIGTAGATIDSSGSGALVFSNSGALGRKDFTAATGTLSYNSGFGFNVIADLVSKPGGGDIQDFVVGMAVNDPDPENFTFETFSRCGGASGYEWTTGGSGLNNGANCIPIAEDPNGKVAGDGFFAYGLDPNEYVPIDVTATGISDDGTEIDISRTFPFVNKTNTTIVFGAVPRTLTLAGSNDNDNEIASAISDSDAGSVVLVQKTGSGKWILSGSNTYTGDTSVENGTLSITSDFLADAADVYLTTDSVLELNFGDPNSPTIDLIDSLYIDGFAQPVGTWGAIGSGAANESNLITGAGWLQVSTMPGDFDSNGRVDAFDFLAWQRNTSLGNLADWEANYGAPSPLTANVTTVPEPGAFVLALIAICFLRGQRR